MSKISKNIFSKGLNRDYDPTNVNAYSMVDNINGRLMFNKRGTLDWVEDNGNLLSFTLSGNSGADANRYVPIGYTGDGNIKVIFSVREDESASEIGILGVDENGSGTYKTLFNDTSDTEKLNFKKSNQICARFLYENNKTIRTYWVDGVEADSNPPRVFTFRYDNPALEKNNVNAYAAESVTAHSMNSQADFNIGIIKFVESVSGGLLSGVYQYTYRLVTNDGYTTPWATPTKKFHVTSDIVGSNWNDYEMEGSGVNTGKGNKIQIKGIDKRYSVIQVAYLYSKTNTVVDSSNIFAQVDIDNSLTEQDFFHLSNDGEPVITSTIAQKFQGIGAAKTLNIKDSVLYYGNVNENRLSISSTELEAILSSLTITPKFRDMLSDITPLNPQNPGPVTNQPTINDNTVKRLNQSATEVYQIKNDYINYKGTQVENLYTGYFRGEVYRFAIVFFDKIGNPYFAFHLADFKFPDQHETAYSWRRLKQDGVTVSVSGNLSYAASPTNDYHNSNLNSTSIMTSATYYNSSYCHLRVMGLEFGGIDVSAISDKISGFSIVRTDRHKTILHQGVILPTIKDSDNTRPWPVAHQRVETTGTGTLIGVYKVGTPDQFYSRPNQSILYAPDCDFDSSAIPTVQSADYLKIVGSCYKEGNTVNSDDSAASAQGGNWNAAHFTYIDFQSTSHDDKSPCVVSKWYRSYNEYHNDNGETWRPRYGNYASIENQYLFGFNETVNNYESSLDFENFVKYTTKAWENDEGFGDGDHYYGAGKATTILYKHSVWDNGSAFSLFNYEINSSTYNKTTQSGALICNYTRNSKDQPPTSAYGGLTASSLEQTIFYSTGHFQPINNSDFTTPATNIYNQIEVFGGDCYLDYFGFLRIYGNVQSPSSYNDDVSYGVVFPLESENNYSLRQAASSQNPMYTDVGSRPGTTQDPAGSVNAWGDGLFFNTGGNLIEEFNYNDVLTFSELTTFFASPPVGFENINQFPVRWRHTQNKFYGDTVDTWRKFETNLYEDLIGVYGPITSSTFLFNQIYSFQETAFGRLRAFDRAALESETTDSLTTGVGPALDGIDYISTSSGNQHQWSLVNTGKGVYWLDVFNGKAMRFAQDGISYLSDLKGMHFYFEKESSFFLNKDNPANNEGILGAWNSKDREVLWTFNRDEYKLTSANFYVISDIIDAITYYPNNETVFVNWSGLSTPGNGIFLAVGSNSLSNNNNNIIQYISLKAGSNSMWVNQNKNNVITGLVQILAGQNYMFYRESNTDDWSFTLLADKSKITPFRATVVYSEYIQSFSQFHSFKPNFYISHNKFLISEQSSIQSRKYYVHGQNLLHANYYGDNHKTSLTVTVSDQGEFAKLFDNVRVAINEQGATKMDKFIFSTEQQKRFYNVQSDTRVRFLEDNFRMPIRTQNQQDRMRGRWLSMIFEFDNNTNYPIKIDNLINHYRFSNRK